MAGRLTVSTLNNDTGVLATQNGMTGIAKAWCNFDGNAVTIRGSFNVSSVTRATTGDYTVNFTNAMPNANYVLCATTSYGSDNAPGRIVGSYPISTAFQTTSIRLATSYVYNVYENEGVVGIAIFSS